MRFETKREREQRRKRQRRSSVTGMILAVIVVLGLGILLWNSKKSLAKKNDEYTAQIQELERQIEEENQRTEELDEYKKYIQTKKFVEEMAKDKFGLIYPNEIVFKSNNK
ncbi:MAG: septum formation initiator family protein [Eubacteriales bacterium]|nr:septum formation initiator family protein [Eubacteriales bacterium]